MRKQIYDGGVTGLYNWPTFGLTLRCLGAEQLAIDNVNNAFVSFTTVHYFHDWNVTVKFTARYIMSHEHETAYAVVELFGGDEQSIGKVEKIILNEAKKERYQPAEITRDRGQIRNFI